MEVAGAIALIAALAVPFLWMAYKASQAPERRSQGDAMAVIVGNTMAAKTTKDGATIILTGRRPQTEPEPDGFIE